MPLTEVRRIAPIETNVSRKGQGLGYKACEAQRPIHYFEDNF